MPPYSYKITADHPVLKRIDEVRDGADKTLDLLDTLRDANYDNIKVVRTNNRTGVQVEQIIPQ